LGDSSPLKLGPSARLRRRSDIDRCQKNGSKLYSKHFLILVLPSETNESRLAIAVTTKIEKRATRRNKIKRRIREIFRAIRPNLKPPIDIVVVARRGVLECDFEEYRRELVGTLRGHGYLPK
jgi:ribonuclease P protein component